MNWVLLRASLESSKAIIDKLSKDLRQVKLQYNELLKTKDIREEESKYLAKSSPDSKSLKPPMSEESKVVSGFTALIRSSVASVYCLIGVVEFAIESVNI